MKSTLSRTIILALPLMVANLVQILMGVIDAAMVGTIHSDLLAANSLVNSIVTIPFVLGMGLTMAIAPLIAAGIGKNDTKEAVDILINATIICGIIAFLLALALSLGADLIFYLGQDEGVALVAKPYLKIIGWSLVPMLLFLALKQFADGVEVTRLPMLLSIYTIPLNIFLNYVLIYGKWGFPRMELEGAGWATFISRVVLFLLMAVSLLKHSRLEMYFRNWKEHFRLRKGIIIKVLKIGIPSSAQYGLESWAFSVSGIMVGWISAQALAAHQIALSLASTSFVIALGLSGAGAIRIGNNYGKGDWHMVRDVGKGVIVLSMILGVTSAIIFISFKTSLVQLFNKETDVIALATTLLILAAMFQLSDAVQAVSVGILRGLQDVRIPTVFVAIAYWVIGIPAGYILAFHFDLGAKGIWIGFLLGLTASAVLLTSRFRRIVAVQLSKK